MEKAITLKLPDSHRSTNTSDQDLGQNSVRDSFEDKMYKA